MSKYFDGDKLSGYEDSPTTYISGEKDKQIAELQKQLEEKEKDNQFLKKMYLSERIKNDNYHTKKYGLDKPVEELRKIKLNPKEKEIYYKGFDNCERQFSTHIADLQHKLEVADRALNKMSNYAINDNDLYNLVIDFNIENGRYDEDHFGIGTCDVVDYFKEQAEKEIKGEKDE